jgi:hypothetical protein
MKLLLLEIALVNYPLIKITPNEKSIPGDAFSTSYLIKLQLILSKVSSEIKTIKMNMARFSLNLFLRFADILAATLIIRL